VLERGGENRRDLRHQCAGLPHGLGVPDPDRVRRRGIERLLAQHRATARGELLALQRFLVLGLDREHRDPRAVSGLEGRCGR
jgi:hypothetical protein